MKKDILVLGLAFSLTLTGCSILKKTAGSEKKQTVYYTLSKEQIDKVAQKKLPQNYRTLVKQYFYLLLGSPNAAKYIFYKPIRAYNPLTNVVFWVIKVEVSTKNSRGNYSGYKSYMFSSNSRGGLVDITKLLNTSNIVTIDEIEKDS